MKNYSSEEDPDGSYEFNRHHFERRQSVEEEEEDKSSFEGETSKKGEISKKGVLIRTHKSKKKKGSKRSNIFLQLFFIFLTLIKEEVPVNTVPKVNKAAIDLLTHYRAMHPLSSEEDSASSEEALSFRNIQAPPNNENKLSKSVNASDFSGEMKRRNSASQESPQGTIIKDLLSELERLKKETERRVQEANERADQWMYKYFALLNAKSPEDKN